MSSAFSDRTGRQAKEQYCPIYQVPALNFSGADDDIVPFALPKKKI